MPIRRRRNPKGDILLSKTITLTNTQIKTLPAFPCVLEVVPAPGSGKFIHVTNATYIIHGNNVAYDFGGSLPNIQLVCGATQEFGLTLGFHPNVNTFKTVNDVFFDGPNESLIGDIPVNLALFVHDIQEGANYTGGDPADILKVAVLYEILDM